MNSREFSSLVKRIRRATEQVAPASVWVDRTKQRLMKRVQQDLAEQAELSFSEKALTFFQSFLPSQFLSVVRGPVLSFLSVLTVVTGGSIASVSAAERSIPGDFLYPLKLAHEQASILFAKTTTDKLLLKTEYVGRRVDEIKALSATPDVPEKGERIKQAAETLKRDFDTVKVQLTEAKQDGQPRDVAQAAKLIDQKTTDAVNQLKNMKQDVSPDVRVKVAEVQAAALNTSVKAVQVMIETKDQPDVDTVVTNADIAQSIQSKVQGIEENVNDAEQKLATVGIVTSSTSQSLSASTSTLALAASSTISLVDASSSVEKIKSVKQVLDQTKQLVVENKLDQAQSSLDQASKAAASIDSSVATIMPLPTVSSSTPSALPSGSVTGTTATTSVLVVPPPTSTSTASTTSPSPGSTSTTKTTP